MCGAATAFFLKVTLKFPEFKIARGTACKGKEELS